MQATPAVPAGYSGAGPSATRPATYRIRVLLLGLLGYVYVLGVLTIVLGLLALVVWLAAEGRGGRAWAVKAVIALGALALIVLRALWVRIPPPWGLHLRPAEAPALFATIEEIRRTSRGPRVHRVLVDDEFNAGVQQVPRLGLLGWPRNYLILGLPLMRALSPAQFRAVLAHEFGHLSGAHNLVSGWVYRVRGTWERLIAALEREEHWGTVAFRPFFRWYVPVFERYSFALRRAHEYEADRNSARVAGPRDSADALAALAVHGDFLQRVYWARVRARAAEEPEPTVAPHGAMAEALRTGAPPADARAVLDRALTDAAEEDDTHPTLGDRLAALGQAPRVPPPLGESAAEHYLGPAAATLAARLDDAWRGSVAEAWRERHAEVTETRRKLAALEANAQLSPDEAWQRAAWTEDAYGAEKARPLYEALLAGNPEHVSALCAVGRLRLEAGDEGGLALVERAMAADPEAVTPGCRLAYRFLAERGRTGEAERYARRFHERRAFLEAAEAERRHIGADSELLAHGLSEATLAPVVDGLAAERHVAAAYLVRKAVRHFPERPVYLLGVERTGLFFGDDEAKALQARLAEGLPLPPETYVVVFRGDTGWLRKRLRSAPGALVFRR